jgi:hypothetical protein
MTTGLAQRFSATLSTAGLPTLKRDRIIDTGLLGLIDAGSIYCRQRKSSFAAGDTLVNLVDGAAAAVVNATLETAGNGIVFDADGDWIDLTSLFLLPATCTHAAWCFWVKLNSTGQSASSAVGIVGERGATGQFWLAATSDGSGNVTTMNSNVDGTNLLTIAGVDAVHQIVLEYSNPTLTSKIVKAYRNATLITSSSGSGIADTGLTAATGADTVRIGSGAGDLSGNKSFKGRFYRAWAANLDDYPTSLEQLIATDYAQNASRFT